MPGFQSRKPVSPPSPSIPLPREREEWVQRFLHFLPHTIFPGLVPGSGMRSLLWHGVLANFPRPRHKAGGSDLCFPGGLFVPISPIDMADYQIGQTAGTHPVKAGR